MYKPFEKLKLLNTDFPKAKNFQLYESPEKQVLFSEKRIKDWEEFLKTVKPLKEKNFFWCFNPKKVFHQEEKIWPPEKLDFKWWLTSEYIEGCAPGISKKVLKELRNGRFSIKRTVNLRGLDAETAERVLEESVRTSIFNGDSCILIIHGRGFSSKGEPVLKNKVKEWLERGPFRKYVLAYTSARPCDGGLGATYVLLSKKPIKR
ncbi:MAG: Smr/MutS family protein [Thermodesulfobacteriaceae bacterium]|nr:Smr/MutS family protein [Thermodesulfobacteriaceae bacterium]MCX8041972.1 Smr/MutS family protein [Thermodesulfobacteriaceae bacterium]MDW8136156.1 Smr/MutS family protein [Thermodesulfobacterium sp.]